MYSDCWTYPKEKIDALITDTKSYTYSKEEIQELIPLVEEKIGSITIGDTLICYGTHKFDSVTTAGTSIDVSLPTGVEYNDSFASIAVNSYYYDSYCDVVASKKTTKAITLWARAVSSTQTDVDVSWITIGKKKTSTKKKSK